MKKKTLFILLVGMTYVSKAERILLDSSRNYPSYHCILDTENKSVVCIDPHTGQPILSFKDVYVNCVQGTPGKGFIGVYRRNVASRPGMSRSCYVYQEAP